MTKYGIKIANKGGTINDKKINFDSGKGLLSVNLNFSPKHFDSVLIKVYSDQPIDSTERYEEVFKIKHNMPFVPRIDSYFNSQGIFTYYKNFYSYVALGSPVNDLLVVSIDETYFTVGHWTYAPISLTSDAKNMPVTMKYYIYNLRGLPRDGTQDPVGSMLG